MLKIATLGPQGTFSEIATKEYLLKNNDQTKVESEIVYFPTLKKSLLAIGADVDVGILPIENFSEGFVNLVLDHLLQADLYIGGEISLPIQFSLVSHCDDIEQVDKVYVQFVAKGQCAEYLDKLENVSLIMTESNTQSLAELADNPKAAAVVPSHLVAPGSFQYTVKNVTDYQDNQTRFVHLSPEPDVSYDPLIQSYKTSIIVLYHKDHPGYLESVLHEFTTRKINLTSIVSRPTRHTFGKYHFFIDLEGHQEEDNVKAALNAIQKTFKLKVLGSYLQHS